MSNLSVIRKITDIGKQGSKNKYISAFSKLWLIKSIFSCLLERYLDFTHIYIFPYAISIPGFTSTGGSW